MTAGDFRIIKKYKPSLDNPGHDLSMLDKCRRHMDRNVSEKIYLDIEKDIMSMLWLGLVSVVESEKYYA